MNEEHRQPSPVDSKSPGCLRVAVAAAALVVLAPLAAVVRAWRRWRRGQATRCHWTVAPLPGSSLRRIELDVDVPVAGADLMRRRLTDTVVRVAETLRSADDTYHLVVRMAWVPEPDLLPLGPLVQSLGERVHLCLGDPDLEGRTRVWLVLPAERALAEVVDHGTYDPEAPGEPDGLVTAAGAHWAAASTHLRCGPSQVFRWRLYVPPDAEAVVVGLLERLLR